MSYQVLFYLYLLNAVLLIDHEIDSAYWQEWNLFPPMQKGGINGFLIFHIPLLFIILYGLVLVHDSSVWGIIISMLVSAGGLFAFFFHFYHLRKGRPEFNTNFSKALLVSTLLVSLVQMIESVGLLF